jgi:hypothetical protein
MFERFQGVRRAVVLALAVSLPTGYFAAGAQAGSWQDAFTTEELETLFGEDGAIPQMIGPHRVVMSLEEAEQIEGEVAPLVLIAIGAGTGALGAWGAGQNPWVGALVGGAGGAGAWLGAAGAAAVGAGVTGQTIGGAIGGGLVGAQFTALTNLGGGGGGGGCASCHQAK